MGQGMQGVTSSGYGSAMPRVVKPAIAAATKTAQANKVKAVSLKVKVKLKKKVA